MKDVDTEILDVLILVSALIGAFTALAEIASDHPSVKIIRTIAIVGCAVLAAVRWKSRRPYSKVFSEADWKSRVTQDNQATEEFIAISKKIHKKGKEPSATVFHEKDGKFQECITEIHLEDDGTVTLVATKPFGGKVTIR